MIMEQNKQIRLAFEIYDKMIELEKAFWDLYYKEFIEIIIAEEDDKSSQSYDPFDEIL